MVHIKIEDGRPVNLNTHVCNCNGKCVTCKCEEKTRQAILETIPSKLKQIADAVNETK